MKYTLIILLCVLSCSLAIAQKTEWKQMESFHRVMSKSYHPVEDGKLQALKDNIDSLVLLSKKWQASAIPPGYEAKKIKPLLDKLARECASLKEAVTNNKSDDTLKKLLTTAHNTFHEIIEHPEKNK